MALEAAVVAAEVRWRWRRRAGRQRWNPRVVDVLLGRRAREGPRVRPGDVRPVLAVHAQMHPVAHETRLDRVGSARQVRHRARRHAVVAIRRRGARGVRDLGRGHVVAAGELAVAERSVVERDPQVAVRRHRAPRRPLSGLAEPRVGARRDRGWIRPGRAAVGRVRVEDVVVAGRPGLVRVTRAVLVRVVPEVGPDDEQVPGRVDRERDRHRLVDRVPVRRQALAAERTACIARGRPGACRTSRRRGRGSSSTRARRRSRRLGTSRRGAAGRGSGVAVRERDIERPVRADDRVRALVVVALDGRTEVEVPAADLDRERPICAAVGGLAEEDGADRSNALRPSPCSRSRGRSASTSGTRCRASGWWRWRRRRSSACRARRWGRSRSTPRRAAASGTPGTLPSGPSSGRTRRRCPRGLRRRRARSSPSRRNLAQRSGDVRVPLRVPRDRRIHTGVGRMSVEERELPERRRLIAPLQSAVGAPVDAAVVEADARVVLGNEDPVRVVGSTREVARLRAEGAVLVHAAVRLTAARELVAAALGARRSPPHGGGSRRVQRAAEGHPSGRAASTTTPEESAGARRVARRAPELRLERLLEDRVRDWRTARGGVRQAARHPRSATRPRPLNSRRR